MPISKAIVLSREPFGEADLYVQFLTQRWGVITTLAKSARKSRRRYIGGLDLFCHDEINVKGNIAATPYLIELVVLNAFTAIRDDLNKVLVAGRLTQWVRKLVGPAMPLPTVYSLLGQSLALTEKEGNPLRLELLALTFKLKLLERLGLAPQLERCARCDSEGPLPFFDMGAGGLLCAGCAGKLAPGGERLTLGGEERELIRATSRLRLSRWPEISLPHQAGANLSKLITRFASFHTHVKLPG